MTRAPSSRPRAGAPPAPPPKQGPTTGVIVLGLVLVLIAFGCGFGALSVQADITQPVAKSAPLVPFTVNAGDSSNTVIANLESQKLIRNGTVFKLYLKAKGITFAPAKGTYQLSASMTISQIIQVLNTPPGSS